MYGWGSVDDGVGAHNLFGSSEADLFCWGDTDKGEWRDVDNDAASCKKGDYATDYPNCVGTDCSVASCEANVGEYNFVGATECCGDDSNEYFTIKGKGDSKYCRESNNCVDMSGTCQTFALEESAQGNCGDGIDNDCDGLTDFPNDPGCCTANEVGLCSDGIDNDCDGLVDCADTADCSCCGFENSECCTSGDDCFGTLYCSTVNPTYLTPVTPEPHCCPTGFWWDENLCVEYATCSPECVSNPFNPACTSPDDIYGCCSFQGGDTYQYITTY